METADKLPRKMIISIIDSVAGVTNSHVTSSILLAVQEQTLT